MWIYVVYSQGPETLHNGTPKMYVTFFTPRGGKTVVISVTKNSAAWQHHLASSRNALFHLASSWTSKLRTQFVSLTLGMGIIVEHHDAVNYMHHTVLEGNIHKGTTNPTAW